MVFIETPVFTRQVQELLSDEDYGEFQQYLAANPEAGPLIPGTGGLRKVRWAVPGGGKSGGVRVIYFYVVAASQIRLLVIYSKGVKDNLTEKEKRVLRELNRSW